MRNREGIANMYLKQIVIENSGPLRRLDFDLAFTQAALPKPLVLVGSNGGGKTNLLSLIADALFEAAAAHYDDVLPSRGMGRAWFRFVGGRTMTLGAPGGFSLLRFEHDSQKLVYREKAGNVDPIAAAQRVPPQFSDTLNWEIDGSFKKFDVSGEQSRLIFQDGVYAYFPSSRSELPFWLNRESIPEPEFEVFTAISKKLRKPLYVEKSLHEFKQWLISVILESRTDIELVPGPPPQFQIQGDIGGALRSASVLELCNTLLRRVLGDDQVRFVWLGRKSPDKVAVARGNELLLPNLDALSGGQSTLLGLFGTLLRYADQSQSGSALDLSTTEGICIVDEIDSHIHVELQHKILPSLMELFPKIQFIVSSHSPLFALGMKQRFGEDGFQLVEMPGGNIVTSETYAEFGKAMEALAATEVFNKKLLSETSKNGAPIVFVEGETDAPYLRRAAEVLGRSQLLGRCEIQWIGAKDEGGQGFHTGKPALDHTLSVLRANPKLTSRAILLLYDNDARKADEDYGGVSVRSMPTNEANTKVKAGIENLLAEEAITDADYQTMKSTKPNGDIVTRKTLRKAELCQRICDGGLVGNFSAFALALGVIESYLDFSKA
jgi:hypothetical protein